MDIRELLSVSHSTGTTQGCQKDKYFKGVYFPFENVLGTEKMNNHSVLGENEASHRF